MKKLVVLTLVLAVVAFVAVGFKNVGKCPNTPDPNAPADPNAPKTEISWFADAAEPNAVEPNDPNVPKASVIVNFSGCKKVAEPNKCDPNDPNAPKK
ncbi:MAG: hypothetical protein WC496_02125 [Phycisphaerae bacterium]|jgi:hypothetical protein